MPTRRIYADLHTHSLCSDGELAPEDVVDVAAEAGLEALALTDHDTVRGVPRAAERGREIGVEVLTGCEMTAYQGEIELHILAFGFDAVRPTPLAALLDSVRDRRRQRALDMAAQLRAAGVALPDEEIFEATRYTDAPGLIHVATALVRLGHASSVFDAADRFLAAGKPGHVKKLDLTPAEVLHAIHASGGIAVLAHPMLEPHDELIAPLFRLGLDGLETDYPGQDEVVRRFYTQLAERHYKVVTGGSDFHGATVREDSLMGLTGVTRGEWDLLHKRIAAVRAALKPSAG